MATTTTTAKPITDPLAPVRPLSPTEPNLNPIPNAAIGISQLADGQGGNVAVPPTSLAPPSVVPPGSSMPSTTPFTAESNLIGQQINPSAGPDRVQLGQQYYDTFNQRAQANFGRALTDATNRAAAHGQIGAGMLTNAYGDLAERFNLDNTTAASDFATHALEGTIGDQAQARNELRGERGYQQDLAQQAVARRIQQEQLEQQSQQQQFNNGLSLYGVGAATDPTAAYQNAAALSTAEAGSNSADVGQLLRYLAMQRQYPSGGY